MFKKYNSIENSYRESVVNKYKVQCPKEHYIVQEKVHGAHFQITYDGNEFHYGSRTEQLIPGVRFYGYETVITESNLESKIKGMYLRMQEIGILNNILTVYGELGGRGIQKGIYYSENKFFYGFDIACDGNIISPLDAVRLFSTFDIFHAAILFSGDLDACMAYPNDFQSTLPFALKANLAIIPTDNVCEGKVIKAINPLFLGSHRVILKDKNKKWSEKANRPKRERKPEPVLTAEESTLLYSILDYCTENRLHNVLSHIGSVSDKDFGKLLGLFSLDILTDYLEDNALNKTDVPSHIRKRVQMTAATMIRDNFINIIDNEF